MKLEISDTAVLADGAPLDGLQLQALIEQLARVRAITVPAVPVGWGSDETIDVTSNPALKVGLTGEGRLLMALRHHGFGWCNFDFSLKAAAALRDFIATRTTSIARQALDDVPDTDLPH